eukprot:2287973-Amphidinium_carterae.1
MGAVSKGRSSSPGLRAELRKLAALQLVCDGALAIGFTRTHRNVADRPSRSARPRQVRQSSE